MKSDPLPPEACSALARMLDRLVHRGPDGSGEIAFPRCLLGHRRLAIIDIEGGRQPMGTPDGRYSLIANAEIYNHLDLRAELESKGHVFRTECDVEAILHGFSQWRTGILDRLQGMFAFAIWDALEEELFLARDRLGQKPLVYTLSNGILAFASELRSLAESPRFQKRPDLCAIDMYLAYQCIPAPLTIYEGARKLPPATYIVAKGDKIRLQRYWHADYANKTGLTYPQARDRLRELVTTATKKRLMADVPLGVFLSGGLDSTIVTRIMSQLGGEPVRTFSIGSADPLYDELDYAGQAAAACDAEHHTRIVAPCSRKLLEDVFSSFGEPFADSSALPTAQVSRFAREHVTVVLTGDGADEAFGGYERYIALSLARFCDRATLGAGRAFCSILGRFLPQGDERSTRDRLRRFLAMCAQPPGMERYLAAIRKGSADTRTALYTNLMRDAVLSRVEASPWEQAFEHLSSRDDVEKFLELDEQTYLPDDILVKIDIAGMRASLEVRSPFLDHEVVEFAASLPRKWKVCGRRRKHILADAFRDLLPPSIRERPKMGFGVPKSAWLRTDLYEFARELLTAGDATCRHLFHSHVMADLIEQHRARRADHSYLLWALVCLELWLRKESVFDF